MPIETKRQAAVLKKLQDVIKHTDPEIASGRKLAIKRWLETYIEHVKYFNDDKLQFLYNLFQDENCWSGIRLNNAVLGQKLTEEKIGEIDNPLRKYEMACSYCVIDKIHPLFQERFEFLKNGFRPGARDGSGNPITDKYVRNSLLDTIKRNGNVFDFWIDRESGELKEYDTVKGAVEGFDSAVKLKWSEGVEYFYNHLKEEDKEKKLTEAIITLSRVQAVKEDAPILDFCVRNIADKDTLLQKLLQKDKAVCSLLAELIESCFFDTVRDLVQCWCYKKVSVHGGHSEKIFSHREYDLLLCSLSDTMLKNPELSVQARSLIMEIWKCGSLAEHKKAVVNTSNGIVPIQDVLAELIVNWKREDIYKSDEEKEIEKKEMLDIILFAKNCFPERFKSFKEVMIKNLRLCGREGKKVNVDYGLFAEELFSELEKAPGPKGDGHPYSLRSQSQAHGSKKATLPLDGSGGHSQSTLKSSSTSGVYSQESPSELEEISSPLDDSDPQSILGSSSVSGVSSLHK
ncbi:cytoplasmic incompatibility factor CifA [Wolbachia endosymbiont (group B) of Eucosma cana]|uniref:cytoplasmic incompatibility factor CifA n=1 Tax=Wolbachia endosymbiont (group B) of Eucosma cana TaxID=2954012 RepID=UPI0029D4193A|nr:cytoplasmic incompatibility factor CifA [Wolbachia endosymbiont (group B) of Eucosma cana]